MADEDLSMTDDQLLDSLDDGIGDSELLNDVRIQYSTYQVAIVDVYNSLHAFIWVNSANFQFGVTN